MSRRQKKEIRLLNGLDTPFVITIIILTISKEVADNLVGDLIQWNEMSATFLFSDDQLAI